MQQPLLKIVATLLMAEARWSSLFEQLAGEQVIKTVCVNTFHHGQLQRGPAFLREIRQQS